MSTRISGLVSGMDIDSLVKDMMKPLQTRIDKSTQQKTKLEWTQEAYNDINTTLARFVLDRTSELGLLRSSSSGLVRSTSNLTWLKQAVSSDDDVAAVSANAPAVTGSFDVTVHRLASNWASASAAALPELPTNADGSFMDSTLANQFSLDPGTAVVDFTITSNSGAIRITSDQSATAEEGVQLVKIDLDDFSMENLASTLNNADIGVKASYDSGIRRFFLQTAESGSTNTLQITDQSTGLGSEVGFLAAPSGGTSLLQLADEDGEVTSAAVYTGVDALLDVGAAKGIVQSSNAFTVNNINFALHELGEVTVTISTDVDTAYDKVKQFVDEYNELLDGLQTKLSEKYDRNYQPLTDEQRAAMSDDQIKQWEERAKTGLLSRSGEISQLVSRIRSDMFLNVEGANPEFNNLTKIGITTEAYSTDGKLVIDETKLKAALRKDADSVLNLLFQSPDSSITDKTEQKQQTGLVNRLFGNIIDGMKDVVDKAGTGDNATLYRSVQTTILVDFVADHKSISVIDSDVSDYAKQLLSLSDRFTMTQTRYYNQFTAMEQAVQQANLQSAWLTQQLSGSSS